jgi:cob(I)alamin adenosyltransferase
MKIYTKTGDQGQTSLLGGQRVEKSHPKLNAYGTVDELNSHIGLLLNYIKNETKPSTESKDISFILEIQNDLFLLGSHIACLDDADRLKYKILDFNPSRALALESEMDAIEKNLKPLKNFILPGGCLSASQAHVCRTVCRRAERLISDLPDYNEDWLIYLNRLSDYFFVLSRHLNRLNKIEDIIWVQHS